jgi:hypothetical protein
LSIFFVNSFFIFHLDKQHPILLEKLPMSAESLFFPISLNPICPRVDVSVGVFTGTYFSTRRRLVDSIEHLWIPGRISALTVRMDTKLVEQIIRGPFAKFGKINITVIALCIDATKISSNMS